MFEGMFRGEHLLVILLVVMVLFPGKLASVGGSLGKSIRDFKKAMGEEAPAPRPGEPGAAPARRQDSA